jgi:hypothetical protein
MKQTKPDHAVMLSTTVHGDLALVPRGQARQLARVEANSLGETVYLRDPVSDEVLDVVEPSSRRERSNG